jgi:hypothetical protein
MPDRHPSTVFKRPEDPCEISEQEVQDVLADEGYSADLRKAWLKDILTELAQEGVRGARDRKILARAVKKIVRKYQAGKPIADDVL